VNSFRDVGSTQTDLFRDVGRGHPHPADISEKHGDDVGPCVEALLAVFDAEVVEDREALELIDLAMQEVSVRAWNGTFQAVPVIGPEGQVTYLDSVGFYALPAAAGAPIRAKW
jgi:hypothetical protein